MIQTMVEENSGNLDDANDVFQESVILIYRKIKDETFQLTASFSTYIYSIAWYVWMREIRVRDLQKSKMEEIEYLENNPESISIEYELHRRYKLYQEYFKKLPKDCQKILKMFLKGDSLKKIAKKMRLKSENYVKKRKYICKKTLIQSIKNDARFNDNVEDNE
jgi:RNA polymerase sigma factor (sigma-70 family)